VDSYAAMQHYVVVSSNFLPRDWNLPTARGGLFF
jgi:hypothetical protein